MIEGISEMFGWQSIYIGSVCTFNSYKCIGYLYLVLEVLQVVEEGLYRSVYDVRWVCSIIGGVSVVLNIPSALLALSIEFSCL